MKNFFLLFSLLAVCLVSCDCGKKEMLSNSWQLIGYGDLAAPMLFVPSPANNVTISFVNDQFQGPYGCNGYSGTFTIGSRCEFIKTTISSSTTIGCNLSPVAADFWDIFTDDITYKVESSSSGHLVFETNNNRFLRFQKIP